jgi:hypothetical protein
MNTKHTIDPKSAATNVTSQPRQPAVMPPASTPRGKRRTAAAASDKADAAGQVLATEASVQVRNEATGRRKGRRNSKVAASPDPKPARSLPSRSSNSSATKSTSSFMDGGREQSLNTAHKRTVARGRSVSDASPEGSKIGLVLKKLRLAEGASVAQLSEATDWQAHSVRGFLSAVVRKRLKLKLASEVGKDGVRRYRIADGAAS